MQEKIERLKKEAMLENEEAIKAFIIAALNKPGSATGDLYIHALSDEQVKQFRSLLTQDSNPQDYKDIIQGINDVGSFNNMKLAIWLQGFVEQNSLTTKSMEITNETVSKDLRWNPASKQAPYLYRIKCNAHVVELLKEYLLPQKEANFWDESDEDLFAEQPPTPKNQQPKLNAAQIRSTIANVLGKAMAVHVSGPITLNFTDPDDIEAFKAYYLSLAGFIAASHEFADMQSHLVAAIAGMADDASEVLIDTLSDATIAKAHKRNMDETAFIDACCWSRADQLTDWIIERIHPKEIQFEYPLKDLRWETPNQPQRFQIRVKGVPGSVWKNQLNNEVGANDNERLWDMIDAAMNTALSNHKNGPLRLVLDGLPLFLTPGLLGLSRGDYSADPEVNVSVESQLELDIPILTALWNWFIGVLASIVKGIGKVFCPCFFSASGERESAGTVSQNSP